MTNKDWTVKEVLDWTSSFLASKNIDSPRLEAECIVSKVLNTNRLGVYIKFETILSDTERAAIREDIKTRVNGTPLAYITNQKEFMGLNFKVNKNVLIPRPETELLVEHVLDILSKGANPQVVVDTFTGSGNIPISILKYSKNISHAFMIDISDYALECAKQNLIENSLCDRATILRGDIFSPLSLYPIKNSVHVITANPPYILSKNIKNLQIEVQQEPVLALDGGVLGLHYYEPTISQAREYLHPGGFLVMEISDEISESVREFFKKYEYENIEVKKDYSGFDRIISGNVKHF